MEVCCGYMEKCCMKVQPCETKESEEEKNVRKRLCLEMRNEPCYDVENTNRNGEVLC